MSKKHHKNIIDDDELPVIALDGKRNPADYPSFDSKGWRYYIKIKPVLIDWWNEFNGSLVTNRTNGGHKNRYRDIEHFARHKAKGIERQWLVWMISPRKVWERESITHKKHVVPWLGDWKARRRNGYWETENKEYIRSLRQAMKDNVSSGQAIRATSPFHVKSLMRWERLADKIDELFEGKPFVDENPHSKSNASRFALYTSMHEKVDGLKASVIHEWMRIHGVDPKNPHEMADMGIMAQMVGQSAAASALTGFAAASSLQPMSGQDGKPNGEQMLNLNGQGIVISPDALLLAQHLVKHSQTFKKPLPPMIEGEVVKEVVKDSSKDKSNGKAN
jgi:hypothetical protein